MKLEKVSYGMSTQVALPYEQAIETVTAALKAEGFGVLTTIDVKATLKQKLDVDFDRYVILGACNPKLAHRALSAERTIGLLLPCNVIVYEAGASGKSTISIVDPIAMLGVAAEPALQQVAEEARSKLQRVLASLTE